MKKLLTLIISLGVMTFLGYSSAHAEPSVKNTFEGTVLSTYLVGSYIDVATAKEQLKGAGFEVIAEYNSVKKGLTLVFTNEALKKEAAKPGRAYAAVLRLFIDEQEQMISFTNPVYFGKAFMQDDYNHGVFNSALESINTAFSGLKGSVDELEYDDLAGYQFMMGMPYFEDFDELGKKSATTADAITKAKAYKKGKAIIFELKLSDTSTLLGYDLGKRTKKFVTKIGRANAAILPWCVAIEDGQAKALNAKYYIALSYPLLNMGGFMGIATVPGAIIKDLEKAFKK